jgi:hypothetical protein
VDPTDKYYRQGEVPMWVEEDAPRGEDHMTKRWCETKIHESDGVYCQGDAIVRGIGNE